MIRIDDSLSIPLSEIDLRFSTASGPGGQHVNRSATRVTLRFDVAGSASLDEPTREKLLERLESRLDTNGVLRLQCQESRSQTANRDRVIARFQQLLAQALVERRRRLPTRPSAAAVLARLQAKRRRSERKRDRGSTPLTDD